MNERSLHFLDKILKVRPTPLWVEGQVGRAGRRSFFFFSFTPDPCTLSVSFGLWVALANSLPLCCFCQWWRLSWVPSRHVAVATGVKGRMKEQVPSLFFSPFFLFPLPNLPLLIPAPLCVAPTGSLASIYSYICHPFFFFFFFCRLTLRREKCCIWGADSSVSS